MAPPLRVMTIASRPSDLAELTDLSRAMASRGHLVSLLYLFAGTEIEWHRGAFESITQLVAERVPGLSVIQLDMLAIHRGAFENNQPVSRVIAQLDSGAIQVDVQPPKAVSPGLAAKVGRRLRDPQGTMKVLTEAVPATLRLMQRVPASLWSGAFTVARRTEDAVLVYSRFQQFFLNFINEASIDVVIIPEDIVGPIWPVAVAAAHAANIPAVVCPYTLANQSEAIQSLKSEPAFQASANAIAVELYPQWRYRNDRVDLVRLPAEHIFAHAELGITPPDPWMMNSGFSDRILVDSQASFDYFRKGGIPAAQMAVVGSVSQDRMFELRQQREARLAQLRRDLGLSGVKPLLLISGCPNQLSAQVPGCEFKTIEDVAAWVGESVAPLSEHYHLVVRPHPNFIEFGGMLARYGVVSTMAPTSSLVPLSDLFIAFASATIRWAIACGIPTVNYDVFHYGYGDFTSTRGVAGVSESRDFRECVRSLTPRSPAWSSLAEAARADSAYWSVMDGQGVARIEHEIEEARNRRANKERESNA